MVWVASKWQKLISYGSGGWKSKIKAPADHSLVRAFFLVHRQPFSHCVLMCQRGQRALWSLFWKDTHPIHMVSAFITNSPTKGSSSITVILTGIYHMNFIFGRKDIKFSLYYFGLIFFVSFTPLKTVFPEIKIQRKKL